MTCSLSEDPELRRLVREIRMSVKFPSRLKSLLLKYANMYGSDIDEKAYEIAAEETTCIWQSIAYDHGGNSMDDLIETLWKPFQSAGGEVQITHSDGELEVLVIKCPIAEAYKRIGQEDYGYLFHCRTDPFIVKGFNPDLIYCLSKTILAGDDCCNHCYKMKE